MDCFLYDLVLKVGYTYVYLEKYNMYLLSLVKYYTLSWLEYNNVSLKLSRQH